MHGYLRGKHVSEVKHAVLLEQSRQFLIDNRDEEEIARVAQRASKQSRAFARLLGAADEVVAHGVCSSKRKQCCDKDEMSRKFSRVSPLISPNSSDGECGRPTPLFLRDLRWPNLFCCCYRKMKLGIAVEKSRLNIERMTIPKVNYCTLKMPSYPDKAYTLDLG